MGLYRNSLVLGTGLICKAALRVYCASLTVNGLHILEKALHSTEREEGRGIITVANHISTLDDPVAWGVLPTRNFLNPKMLRWTLGASEIMFTNPVFSSIFRTGQVLETFRGRGVHQPAVDDAIELLDKGHWIHMFSEGKVTQPHKYDEENGVARLRRFKWGIGRIAMEAARPPLVIPMWLTGFDKLMPEGRPFPHKFFPRFGQHITITFGEPIDVVDLTRALDVAHYNALKCLDKTNTPSDSVPQAFRPMPWLAPDSLSKREAGIELAEQVQRIRSEVTAVIQRAVESLGRRVSGNLMGKL